MLDHRIDRFLSTDKHAMLRGDTQAARRTLVDLNIPLDSDLALFYLRYQGPFVSPKRLPELLDIQFPTAEVVEQTEFVRAEYGIPEDFVCLTTTEGEGMYLYRVSTGGVYDIGIEESARLADGGVVVRWESFSDFLMEFFGLH